MPTNILMPALSPTMEKGKLAKWLKKEGDKVKSGDVLAEIETDKATMEVEAVDEGTVGKILVAEGTDDVAVNTPIAVLLGEGEKAGDIKAAGADARAEPAKPEAAKPMHAKAEAQPRRATREGRKPARIAARQANGAEGSRVFASPLARRIAKEKGVDLAALQGSGPHGRIVLKDVEGAKPGAKPPPQAAARHKQRRSAPPMADEAIAKLYEPGSYEVVPHDGMRKIIAQRLRAGEADDPAFLSDDLLRSRKSSRDPRAAQRACAARQGQERRPGSCRSTISSSRRWRWRCSACPTPMPPGPKAAC